MRGSTSARARGMASWSRRLPTYSYGDGRGRGGKVGEQGEWTCNCLINRYYARDVGRQDALRGGGGSAGGEGGLGKFIQELTP